MPINNNSLEEKTRVLWIGRYSAWSFFGGSYIDVDDSLDSKLGVHYFLSDGREISSDLSPIPSAETQLEIIKKTSDGIWEVDGAHSFREAHDLLEKKDYDVILLATELEELKRKDKNLLSKLGLELRENPAENVLAYLQYFNGLKQSKGGSPPKLILLTYMEQTYLGQKAEGLPPTPEMFSSAIRSGTIDIRKPFTVPDLAETVEGILTKHYTETENGTSRLKEYLYIGMGHWGEWLRSGDESIRKEAVKNLLLYRKFSSEKAPQTSVGIFMNDLECAEGVIQVIDPDKDYSNITTKTYLLKMTNNFVAQQMYEDWHTYFAPEESIADSWNVRTAEIFRKPLPIKDECDNAFILQEDLIGPNSADVLFMLNEECPDDPRAKEIRDIIVSRRIDEYIFWKQNIPTLTESGKYSIQQVIDGYKRRWIDFFAKFDTYTNVSIIEDQLKTVKKAIESYPWSDLITPDTIMRYFSGTFRNSVIKTGKINIKPKELISMFFNGDSISEDALTQKMYTIDHSARDIHYQEDIWEILNNFHARISEEKKKELYDKIANEFEDMPPNPYQDPNALVMNIYRNCREAGLFSINYWEKLVEKNKKGLISDNIFAGKKSQYIENIQHHIYHAAELIRCLPSASSLYALIEPLETCSAISELRV